MPTVRKFVKYLGWAVAILLLLLIGARLLLAPLTSRALVNFFSTQGVEAKVDDLSFDLVDGRAALIGLSALADGKPVLTLGRLELGWSWSALSENRLRIESLLLDGVDLEILRGDDGSMTIAGIDLSAPADQAPAEAIEQPAEPLAWSLELARFEMTETRVCYRAPQPLDYCNRLQRLAWNGELAFDLDGLDAAALPLRAGGDLVLAGFESRNNGLDRALARFDRFAIEAIAIDTDVDIAVGTVTVDALNLFERASPDESPFIQHVDKIEIRDTRLERGQLLTVSTIEVLGNATDLVKSETDGLELNAWLAALGHAPQTDAAGEAPAAGTASSSAVGNATSGSDNGNPRRRHRRKKPSPSRWAASCCAPKSRCNTAT